MIITLITNDNLSSITLPEKREGQYWLKNIIGIEAIDDNWYLKANRKVSIIDYTNGREEVKKIKLEPIQIYHIYLKDTMEEMIVFTESITVDRQEYKKVVLEDNSEITIGRNKANDIIFSNPFVSSEHAILYYQDGEYYLEDLNSTNGTFVNQERIAEAEFEVGDTIYIMGLKIIIGIGFIAINNPDNNVILNTNKLSEYIPRKLKMLKVDEEDDEDEDFEIEEEYFTRSPRFKREIEPATFNLASAPPGQNPDDTPAILTFGPSLTMGMGSMVSAVTSLATFQIPAAITSLGMLAGSLGFPTASRKYQEKLLKEREEARKEKFTEYLNHVKERIKKETDTQKEILEENFITTRACAKRIKNIDRSLWERTRDQNDFLKLRVGTGETKLSANINYQKKDFDLDTDYLNEQVKELAESPKVIKNVPIIISFYQAYMSGIIGNREKVIDFVKGLILQIVAYYGYDEVKLVFLYDKEEEEYFEFTKWLPHTWNNEQTFHFIATNENDIKEVSTYLDKEINQRIQLSSEELQEDMPYYVVFALSRDLSIRSDIVKKLTSIKRNINMSLIACFDELRYIPKECSTVIELEEQAKIYNKYDITGNRIIFDADIMISKDLTSLSKKLANIKLDLNATGELYSLPTKYNFLEMYKVGKVEHLNSLTRWTENNPTRSLKAPIGVNKNGNVFYLDLHEKFHGPHALVAGMTGSGKSEFLITYILSLALNYHPDEVSFILIDYKGGGMANALEKLPHVAGVITNLDNSEIDRALVSIQSELLRRQNLFNEARISNNVSNMDIYSYQNLYREGKVKEPLPHLFIIADEFAELKSQKPDFIPTMISSSRIGRSLGIHLILATQKPSGVIDDQIWGNAKSKICLKVQDRADSMDMLKREEAAEIIETGRFYLQVGYNESFELGQSAWAGADYYPQEKVFQEKDDSIKILDAIGQVINEGKIENPLLHSNNNEKQIDAILKYIIKLATEEQIKIRPIWQEQIKPDIYLEDINSNVINTEISPLIGEYDDQENQKISPLYLPLAKGNIAIFGIPGSGLTMFLKTTIYSLIKSYKAQEVGMYILDFNDETLNSFKKASHVGDVVFSNENEKVINLFKLLSSELETRKKILAKYNGNIDQYNQKNDKKIQKLFIIIHNYELFKELYNNIDDNIRILASDGNRYGIYFIITLHGSSIYNQKILQSFKQQIALQQKEKVNYSSIIDNANIVPAEYVGRGIIKLDKVYEFQVAHITKEQDEQQFIENFCQSRMEDYHTKRIPILPDIVNRETVQEYLTEDLKEIPIGINIETLEVCTYNFKNTFLNFIFRDYSNSYNKFINSIIKLYTDNKNYKTYIFDINDEWDVEKATKVTMIDESIKLIADLQKENLRRFKIVDKGLEDENNHLDNIVIIINSIAELNKLIENNQEALKDLNDKIMHKGKATYNINVIIVEESKNINSLRYYDWYKEQFDGNNAIWLGQKVDDININVINDINKMLSKTIDIKNEYGYAIKNSVQSKIKLLDLEEE